MRKALNSNPVVQAGALGVLVLVVGFMLVTRMGGGSPEAPATTDPAATESAPGAVAVPGATGTAPADPSAAVDPSSLPAPGPTPAETGFEAGPGLPKDVVKAYDAGKVVVLLIVRNSGIDDNKVKSVVQSLGSRGDVAVFTTRASGIADYSRIAEGAEVSRVPALIVIRPKKFSDGSLPTASVSYGFRSEASIKQKVEDALYKGRSDLPYYPK